MMAMAKDLIISKQQKSPLLTRYLPAIV